MEGSEVVLRDQDQRPLIETSFHGIIKLLAKDARAIQSIRTAMRSIGRRQLDVRGVVGNGKVVGEILSGLGVLLLRETGAS